MNKKLAIVAGLFLTTCFGLFAQETVAMRASIPFDFRMGDKLVPAGTYLIETSGPNITLRGQDGRTVAVSFMSIPESRVAPPESGELVFHRYSNTYFLATVWTPYSAAGHSLPKTAQEKQFAKLTGGLIGTAAVRVK